MSGHISVGSRLQSQGLSSRRLEQDADIVKTAVRPAVAAAAGVSIARVSVDVVTMSPLQWHVSYLVAIATVNKGEESQVAAQSSQTQRELFDLAHRQGSGNVTAAMQSAGLLGADDSVSFVDPEVEALPGTFPACDAKPSTVQFARGTRFLDVCTGRRWVDDPCELQCISGYRAVGAYECSTQGIWEGTPQCKPEWVSGSWSTCSSTCGPGIQTRIVSCPGGDPDECVGIEPPTQQSCYRTEGCSWLTEAWGTCSATCGSGILERGVTCSSGAEEDCVDFQRPENQTACRETEGCSWDTSVWGPCSRSCGSGTQLRTVTCASGNALDCAALTVPLTIQQCYDTSGCAWSLEQWTPCSNTCGDGVQTRSVFCPSGAEVDCPSLKPASTQSCRDTQGCAWTVGNWESCSTDCGSGQKYRDVVCPSGDPNDCPIPMPSMNASCYATTGCVWTTTAWTSCSSLCGAGTQSRSASCSGLQALDCQGSAPPVWQNCYDTSGCAWQTADWSECSTSCGAGFQTRVVSCPSGTAVDCGSTSEPSRLKACYEVSTCQWQVEPWSACSSTCGAGEIDRIVSCPTGVDADCAGQRPSSKQACFAESCNFTVGEWSACDSTCGSSTQHRSVTCSGDVSTDCLGPAPVVEQSCTATHGCTWSIASWGQCSNSCGAGTRARSVTCPTGIDSHCPGAKPAEYENCYQTSGCTWNVSATWGACSVTCGPGEQLRSVLCPSGHDRDCSLPMPDTKRSCRGNSCNWQVSLWGACSVACGVGEQYRNVTCPSGVDAECVEEKPATKQSCTGTDICHWTVSSWSSQCSSSCGAGVLTRSVSCPDAGPGGECSGTRPSTEQTCYDYSGCEWHASNWGPCSETCGWGTRTRSVTCPSGRDGDCHGDRPVDAGVCKNVSGCVWITTEWDECSETCGRGTQTRKVSCVSGIDGDCVGQRPLMYQDCHATAGCSWRTSEWSACSAWCGAGLESRNVICSSGSDADCESLGPKPSLTRTCNTTAGCGWALGAWSACNATCGSGVQQRQAVCTKDEAQCAVTPPLTQACYDTTDCHWIASDWGQCSTGCGPGIQSRRVTCSGGIDSADCADLPKLADRKPCNGTDSCKWTVSPWTLCSAQAACGNGTRTRALFCTGGSDADCPLEERPDVVQECFESPGCKWQVGRWASCSTTCGNGIQKRQVTCPAGKNAPCRGKKPQHSRACQAPKGQCEWHVGKWSNCSTTCGKGIQERNVSCSSDSTSDCSDNTAPPAKQTCWSSASCVWKVSEWGRCSSQCGAGTRTRDVACSSGSAKDCGNLPRPLDAQNCQGNSECQWQVSEWSLCAEPCGTQTRSVKCPSGNVDDCQEPAPAEMQDCPGSCKNAILSFDLHISLGDKAAGNVQDIIDATRAALVIGLSAPVDAVEVSLADDLRRLSIAPGSLELQLLCKVNAASLKGGVSGVLQQLKTLTGDAGALLELLRAELTARGIDATELGFEVGAIQIGQPVKSTSVDDMYEPQALRNETFSAHSPPTEQHGGGKATIGIAVGTALGAALLCGLAMASLRRSKKIAPRPPSPSPSPSSGRNDIVVWGIPDDADKVSNRSESSTRPPSNRSSRPPSSAPSLPHQGLQGLEPSSDTRAPSKCSSQQSTSMQSVPSMEEGPLANMNFEDAFKKPSPEFDLGEPPSFTFSLPPRAIPDCTAELAEPSQIAPPPPPPTPPDPDITNSTDSRPPTPPDPDNAESSSGTSSSGALCCTAGSTARFGGGSARNDDPPSPLLLAPQAKAVASRQSPDSSMQPVKRLTPLDDQMPPVLLPPVLPGGPPVVQRPPSTSEIAAQVVRQQPSVPDDDRNDKPVEQHLQTSGPGRGLVPDEIPAPPNVAQPRRAVRQRQPKAAQRSQRAVVEE